MPVNAKARATSASVSQQPVSTLASINTQCPMPHTNFKGVNQILVNGCRGKPCAPRATKFIPQSKRCCCSRHPSIHGNHSPAQYLYNKPQSVQRPDDLSELICCELFPGCWKVGATKGRFFSYHIWLYAKGKQSTSNVSRSSSVSATLLKSSFAATSRSCVLSAESGSISR